MEKPSGGVIWIVVTPKLDLHSYPWFGGCPGEPLPDIRGMKKAQPTKGNAEGIKTERPNHQFIPRGEFEPLATLDEVIYRLFGRLGLLA
jgi:hypothetical protein